MEKGTGKKIWLEDRFRIDLEHALPAFATGTAQAYDAEDSEKSAQPLGALIGRARLPRREPVLARLLREPLPACLKPVADGVVELPDGSRNWAVVFERPEGESLAAHAHVAPFGEDMLRRVVLPLAMQALEACHAAGLAHRSTRPGRLYWQDSRRTRLILGDCFSEPPGFGQPAIFEPLERAAAAPAGRGEGTPACDLFALGMTLVALASGREEPLPPSDEVLDLRFARGTAALVVGGLPLSSEFKIALQGLLSDDVQRRWSLADLRLWLKGAQPVARNTALRPSQPVSFAGHSLGNRRLLARVLGRAAPSAPAFLRSEAFAIWVQNGLNDPEAARQIRTIRSSPERQVGHGFGEVLAIRRILDPMTLLPLGRAQVAIDGLGPMLAEAYRQSAPEQVSAFGKLFQSGLPLDAAAAPAGVLGAPDELQRTIAPLQGFVARPAPGAGLERVLYELNPGQPCLSPILGNAFVTNIRDLLLALDAAAGAKPAQLVDRHIAAFVAAHAAQAGHLLAALDGPKDEASRVAAQLAVLACLQSIAGIERLPGLTAFFVAAFRTMVGRFHSLKHREAAHRVLDRLAGSGNLALLEAEVRFDDWKRQDEAGYRAARNTYQRCLTTEKALMQAAAPGDPEAIRAGQRGALGLAYAVLLGSVVLALAVA